jgi:HTH-type transcriptional regulator, glycine betaine synthesis regulator
MEGLHISRGNASMNLRELVDWGIVQRVRRAGDRKDLYQSTGDVFTMFARVVRERKRRELDPTTAVLGECLSMVEGLEDDNEARVFRQRLETLTLIFGMIDHVYGQVFASDETFKRMMLMLDPAGSESGSDPTE